MSKLPPPPPPPPGAIAHTQPETRPGLPANHGKDPVSDSGWVPEDLEHRIDPQDPAPNTNNGTTSNTCSSPAPVLKPRTTPPKKSPRISKLENQLTIQHWELVRDLFSQFGSPIVIAQHAELTPTQVEHLLENGLQRAGLPSIRDYYVDKAEVNLELQKHRQEREQALVPQTNAAEAIQQRATQEALAAQRLLDVGADLGTVLKGVITPYAQAIQEGRVDMPENVTRSALKDLSYAFEVYSKAMDRAVKMVRLTAGEPTEILGAKIGVLLQECDSKELQDAIERGTLPRRLRGRSGPGPDPVAQAETRVLDQEDGTTLPIDVDYQPIDIEISEEGKPQDDEA